MIKCETEKRSGARSTGVLVVLFLSMAEKETRRCRKRPSSRRTRARGSAERSCEFKSHPWWSPWTGRSGELRYRRVPLGSSDYFEPLHRTARLWRRCSHPHLIAARVESNQSERSTRIAENEGRQCWNSGSFPTDELDHLNASKSSTRFPDGSAQRTMRPPRPSTMSLRKPTPPSCRVSTNFNHQIS